MTQGDAPLQTHFEQGKLLVASCERVVVVLIGELITVDFLAAASSAGKQAAAQWGKIAALSIVAPDLSLPNPELRARAQRDSREADAWVGAGATVIRETGLRASIVRSVLLGMSALASGPPRRVFDSVPGALMWLGEKLEISTTAQATVTSWLQERLGSP